MLTALHRDTGKVLDALAYEKEYGKPVDWQGNKVIRPFAICAVCGQDVFLRAANSAKRTPNFCHFKGTAFCATKAFNAQAYRHLHPVNANPQAALALRAAFFATWKWHLAEFDRIVHYATIHDFCAVLKYANQHNLWAYRGMRVQDVLPVLLTLKDFAPQPAAKSHLRDYGIRFFYKGTVANTSQYWNLPLGTRSIVMTKYNFPGRTRTFKSENISGSSNVTFQAGYLAGQFGPEPATHDYPTRVMLEQFPGDVTE